MSLDIYLYSKKFKKEKCTCSCCDNEHEKEYRECFFNLNITHNLGKMASECGLYDSVWRPDENNINEASQMIPILEKGLEVLLSDPKRFKKLNPENGWGSYENLIEEMERYLKACKENPNSEIKVWR